MLNLKRKDFMTINNDKIKKIYYTNLMFYFGEVLQIKIKENEFITVNKSASVIGAVIGPQVVIYDNYKKLEYGEFLGEDKTLVLINHDNINPLYIPASKIYCFFDESYSTLKYIKLLIGNTEYRISSDKVEQSKKRYY